MHYSIVPLTGRLLLLAAVLLTGCVSEHARYPDLARQGSTIDEASNPWADAYIKVSRLHEERMIPPLSPGIEKSGAETMDAAQDALESAGEIDSIALPAGPASDLWERIRRRFVLPQEGRDAVNQELRWYTGHADYLARVEKRATPYLYHIVEEVERRNMPGEIALLPIVESGFQPWAYSQERASGLWQFVPGTGDQYGLKRTWWYDGRRDVMESTRAALDYLSRLYTLFDEDWLVAIAAYNSGEGRVLEARRKNRSKGLPTDFWSLKLPRETRTYVPRLLAAARIVLAPQEHGVSLVGIPNEPYFQSIPVGSQIDLVVACDLVGMEIEDLFRLNPAFKRWATDPDGPHRLLVPADRARAFSDALSALPREKRLRWTRHQVKAGDTLSQIAKKYGTTAGAVRKANALKSNLIRAGKDLLIPLSGGDLPAYAMNRTPRGVVGSGGKIVYTVQPGDSLWEIARRFGVKLRRLAAWNGLSTRDLIHPGQDLVLYAGKQRVVRTKATDQRIQRIHYTVKRGDSLDRISRRFNVTVAEIREWNEARLDGRYIHPGQELTLYVDLTRQTL